MRAEGTETTELELQFTWILRDLLDDLANGNGHNSSEAIFGGPIIGSSRALRYFLDDKGCNKYVVNTPEDDSKS